MVDLNKFKKEEPHKLSQGQKQKLCIASVLATDPQIIILDEPTSQLDYRNSKNIHEILKKLNEDGKTILLIEHDTDFLAEYTSKMLVMNGGSIVKDGETSKILSKTNLLKRLGIKIPRVIS